MLRCIATLVACTAIRSHVSEESRSPLSQATLCENETLKELMANAQSKTKQLQMQSVTMQNNFRDLQQENDDLKQQVPKLQQQNDRLSAQNQELQVQTASTCISLSLSLCVCVCVCVCVCSSFSLLDVTPDDARYTQAAFSPLFATPPPPPRPK